MHSAAGCVKCRPSVDETKANVKERVLCRLYTWYLNESIFQSEGRRRLWKWRRDKKATTETKIKNNPNNGFTASYHPINLYTQHTHTPPKRPKAPFVRQSDRSRLKHISVVRMWWPVLLGDNFISVFFLLRFVSVSEWRDDEIAFGIFCWIIEFPHPNIWDLNHIKIEILCAASRSFCCCLS